MSDRPSNRIEEEYVCENCRKAFHPWHGSARRFCSSSCVHEAERLALAAHYGITPEQVTADPWDAYELLVERMP